MDMQKSGLTKEKSKFLISKYFKNNLIDKLNEIFALKDENNSLETFKNPKSPKKRGKNQKKNNQKKKLIFDNSYFFKSSKEKDIPLKNISISQQEESNENSFKEKQISLLPRKAKEKRFGRKNGILKGRKKERRFITFIT